MLMVEKSKLGAEFLYVNSCSRRNKVKNQNEAYTFKSTESFF